MARGGSVGGCQSWTARSVVTWIGDWPKTTSSAGVGSIRGTPAGRQTRRDTSDQCAPARHKVLGPRRGSVGGSPRLGGAGAAHAPRPPRCVRLSTCSGGLSVVRSGAAPHTRQRGEATLLNRAPRRFNTAVRRRANIQYGVWACVPTCPPAVGDAGPDPRRVGSWGASARQ